MNIKVITVGKLKEKYLKAGIAEYAKRLSKFCKFEMIEVESVSMRLHSSIHLG